MRAFVSSRSQPLSPDKKAEFDRRSRILAADQDSPDVEARCRQLLRDFPNEALAHFLLGRHLYENRRTKEALPYSEAAHRLAPDNANYAYYLGFIYVNLNIFDLALPLLRQAYEKGGANTALFAEALADCYFLIGKGEIAIPIAEKALALCKTEDDENRVMDLICRIFMLSDETEQAQSYIAKLAARGGSYAIQAAVWQGRASKLGADSDAGKKLRDLLDSGSLTPVQRSIVLLTLGRLYENDKNHDAAFESWRESREIAAQDIPAPRDYGALLEHMKTLYSPDLFESLKAHGNPSSEPVFIVGMPRSGTTLTEQIIGSHPQSVGVGEVTNLGQMARYFNDQFSGDNGKARMIDSIKKGELRKLADEGLQLLRVVSGRPASRIVEKTPHHFMAVGYLALCFPNAKFIHCCRHPMDSFISSYQNQMSRYHAYSFRQETYGREYLGHVRLMDFWKSLIPDRILTLPYEHLAVAPDTLAPAIVDFTGLPWHDDCLKFFQKAGTVRTFSSQQVRQPVYSTSVQRWRRYEKHLQPLSQYLEGEGYTYPY